jgi:hypothetical protein
MDESVQEWPPVRDEVSNRQWLAARVIAVPSAIDCSLAEGIEALIAGARVFSSR